MTNNDPANAELHIGPDGLHVDGAPFPLPVADEPITVTDLAHDSDVGGPPLFEVQVTLLVPSGRVTVDDGLLVDGDGDGTRKVRTRRYEESRTATDRAIAAYSRAHTRGLIELLDVFADDKERGGRDTGPEYWGDA